MGGCLGAALLRPKGSQPGTSRVPPSSPTGLGRSEKILLREKGNTEWKVREGLWESTSNHGWDFSKRTDGRAGLTSALREPASPAAHLSKVLAYGRVGFRQ